MTELMSLLVERLQAPMGREFMEFQTSTGAVGWRVTKSDALKGTSKYHPALDLSAKSSSPSTVPFVYAMHNGVVLASGNDKNYGNHIVIGNEVFLSLYAHLESLSPLSKGTNVNKGDIIGKMGNTGNSASPHLHIELSASGLVLDISKLGFGISVSAYQNDMVSSKIDAQHYFGQALSGFECESYSRRKTALDKRAATEMVKHNAVNFIVASITPPSAKYRYNGSITDHQAASTHLAQLLKLGGKLNSVVVADLAERRIKTVEELAKLHMPAQVREVLTLAAQQYSANQFLFTLGTILRETRLWQDKNQKEPSKAVQSYNLFGIKSHNSVGLKAYDEGASVFKEYTEASLALESFRHTSSYVFRLDHLGVGFMFAASAASYYGSAVNLADSAVRALGSSLWAPVVKAMVPTLNLTHEILRAQLLSQGTFFTNENQLFGLTHLSKEVWQQGNHRNYVAAHDKIEKVEASLLKVRFSHGKGKVSEDEGQTYMLRVFTRGVYQLVPVKFIDELRSLGPLPLEKVKTKSDPQKLKEFEEALKRRYDLTSNIFAESVFCVHIAPKQNGYSCESRADLKINRVQPAFQSTSTAVPGSLFNPISVSGLGLIPSTNLTEYQFVNTLSPGYMRIFERGSDSIGLSKIEVEKFVSRDPDYEKSEEYGRGNNGTGRLRGTHVHRIDTEAWIDFLLADDLVSNTIRDLDVAIEPDPNNLSSKEVEALLETEVLKEMIEDAVSSSTQDITAENIEKVIEHITTSTSSDDTVVTVDDASFQLQLNRLRNGLDALRKHPLIQSVSTATFSKATRKLLRLNSEDNEDKAQRASDIHVRMLESLTHFTKSDKNA